MSYYVCDDCLVKFEAYSSTCPRCGRLSSTRTVSEEYFNVSGLRQISKESNDVSGRSSSKSSSSNIFEDIIDEVGNIFGSIDFD